MQSHDSLNEVKSQNARISVHQSYQKPQKFKQISILVDEYKPMAKKTKKTAEIFSSIEHINGKKLMISTLDQDH